MNGYLWEASKKTAHSSSPSPQATCLLFVCFLYEATKGVGRAFDRGTLRVEKVASHQVLSVKRIFTKAKKNRKTAIQSHCSNPEVRIPKKLQEKFEAAMKTPMKRASKQAHT